MTSRLKRRILLVDDDLDVLTSLGNVLAQAGYDVAQASNGTEAIQLWRELRGGDLAIVDLFMPEKEAAETIVRLRAHSPGVPIIAMAGGEGTIHEDLLSEAQLLGRVVTLRKPFNAHALLALVARTLANANPDEP